jgi:hypothetical protein
MAASTFGPAAADVFLHYDRHSEEDVRSVFTRYDADGDARLNASEMRDLLRDVGLLNAFDTAEDIAFLKRQLAAASPSGAVSFAEFLAYLDTVAAPPRAKPLGATRSSNPPDTKISCFAEDRVLVAADHASTREAPGTPDPRAERAAVSRHGFVSKIPTPPSSARGGVGSEALASLRPSRNARNGSPGSASRFGFDERFVSASSPATPTSGPGETRARGAERPPAFSSRSRRTRPPPAPRGETPKRNPIRFESSDCFR